MWTGGGTESPSLTDHHCVSEVPGYEARGTRLAGIWPASSRRLWRVVPAFQRVLVSRQTFFCCFP